MNVLIYTDESIHALFLRRVLERAGYCVTRRQFEDAPSQDAPEERAPDVILLDTHFFATDSRQAAREVLNNSPCPIVLLSSKPPRKDADPATACSTFGRLTKPFTSDQLLQALAGLSELGLR